MTVIGGEYADWWEVDHSYVVQKGMGGKRKETG